jgi:hypothetical protein
MYLAQNNKNSKIILDIRETSNRRSLVHAMCSNGPLHQVFAFVSSAPIPSELGQD